MHNLLGIVENEIRMSKINNSYGQNLEFDEWVENSPFKTTFKPRTSDCVVTILEETEDGIKGHGTPS